VIGARLQTRSLARMLIWFFTTVVGSGLGSFPGMLLGYLLGGSLLGPLMDCLLVVGILPG
jgi:hypothetical protein